MKKYFCSAVAFLFQIYICGMATAQEITPQLNSDGTYGFTIANMYFEVDPGYGARISSLQLDGEEILYGSKTSGDSYLWGATLWQSPQSEWNWPPSVALDQDAYSGGIIENSVSLISAEDYDYDTHLTFRKTFTGNLSDTSVKITYSLINNGTEAHEYSGWELTRVPSGGMAFFPYGSGDITGNFAEEVEKTNNIAWYKYDGNEDEGRKYYSDGSQGWDAWLSDNRILYIRKFDDVANNKQAPGENEIELWFNGHDNYIELEIQSEYTNIAPEDSLTWDVEWFLRKLPAEISTEVGSESLINYVQSVLGNNPVSTISIKEPDSFAVFPNPSSGRITIQSSLASIKPLELTIFNLQGQNVYYSELIGTVTSINLMGLANGVYIYTINGTGIIPSKGKITINK